MEVFKGVDKAFDKMDFEDINMEDTFEAIEALGKGTVGPVTGLPIKTTLEAWEGMTDISDGEVLKGTAKLSGWTPFVVEKRFEE